MDVKHLGNGVCHRELLFVRILSEVDVDYRRITSTIGKGGQSVGGFRNLNGGPSVWPGMLRFFFTFFGAGLPVSAGMNLPSPVTGLRLAVPLFALGSGNTSSCFMNRGSFPPSSPSSSSPGFKGFLLRDILFAFRSFTWTWYSGG
ncbi:hypothetical protein N7G274_005300 [Stereocaulon virgatum]|uniref:Uncharacterized protein n=1 Tax=Stereocaulon virgatum TaxID=373712 RepID=A0ABR4A894_9LECA